VIDCIDQSIVTWMLSLVCAPHLIKNPYLTAKLVEVLFVTSPTIQSATSKIYNMVNFAVQTLKISNLLLLSFLFIIRL
jgi:ubiquitin conjugation factor E4 B